MANVEEKRPTRAAGRCFGEGDPMMERYHDEEWGLPVLDERGLFERMSLEAFQSGLSWRSRPAAW
jgi:DNA-3-methyladenine glycosylase I